VHAAIANDCAESVLFKHFHESVHYEPIFDRLTSRGRPGRNVSFSSRDIPARNRIMS
jgi:hypothetical protein